jgi:Zn-dependent protease
MDGLNFSRMIQEILLVAPGFLLAITVHEFAHGYVAYRFGDHTAKSQGRLTFNPISHLDLFGTLVLVVTRTIGWAKPVPIDPRNLRHPRSDMMWISLAGPVANLATAVILALALHPTAFLVSGMQRGQFSYLILNPFMLILYMGVRINVVLAVFNIIPVPRLDGSKILAGLLPRQQAYQFEKLEPYGFLILMLLIFTNVITYVISPPITFIFSLLLTGLI